MERLISISVTTKTWTEGNHAWFDAQIKPGSVVEVHWGDGRHSTFPDLNGKQARVEHYYRGDGRQESFEIEFLSEDADALITLIDGTWEMTVHDVRLKNCPALKALQYCQAYNIDFKGSPKLELIDCHEYYGTNLDISTLKLLRHLSVRMSPFITTLNLNKNPSVEVLDVGYCDRLTKIIVANDSRLRLIANDFNSFDRHTLEWLHKTVDRNNGKFVEWIDVAFPSVGIMGK